MIYKIFLTINEWHTPKSVECLHSLLQPKHLLKQYFKRHYDVCKSCALLAVHSASWFHLNFYWGIWWMDKPTCNGVKMYREEKDVYLKTTTFTLACTNVRYPMSCVVSGPSMPSCGWCKTIITYHYDLASPKIQRYQSWWKHEHYDYDHCLETLTLTGSA